MANKTTQSTQSTQSTPKKHSGGCLCGGVRYRIEGELDSVINCFCGQCRKASGHYVAATRVLQENLHLEKQDTLRWYASSAIAERGFCGACGSSLFWRAHAKNIISIMAGSIDASLGVKTIRNIFVESAGDYHALPPLHES